MNEILADLREAIEALEKAEKGLRAGTPEGLDQFSLGIGFAWGRLSFLWGFAPSVIKQLREEGGQ